MFCACCGHAGVPEEGLCPGCGSSAEVALPGPEAQQRTCPHCPITRWSDGPTARHLALAAGAVVVVCAGIAAFL